MDKELEQTETEQKIQKVIDDADLIFNSNNHSGRGDERRYCRENLRCEFLKVHLKLSLETIDHMKRMEKVNNEFYTKALNVSQNES